MLLFKASQATTKQRVEILKKQYPRHKLNCGSAHWTAGNKNPSALDVNSYDIVIAGDLRVLRNPRSPIIAKAHTYMKNSLNLGISLAGMWGMNSNIWQKHMFDTKRYPTMVSRDQFEVMCFMFAFFSIHFSTPVAEIRTHEEYARMPYPAWNRYPAYPRGYFPARWDLMGLGPEMRNKINYYRSVINSVYN